MHFCISLSSCCRRLLIWGGALLPCSKQLLSAYTTAILTAKDPDRTFYYSEQLLCAVEFRIWDSSFSVLGFCTPFHPKQSTTYFFFCRILLDSIRKTKHTRARCYMDVHSHKRGATQEDRRQDQKADPVPMLCAFPQSQSAVRCLLRRGARQKQKRTFLKTKTAIKITSPPTPPCEQHNKLNLPSSSRHARGKRSPGKHHQQSVSTSTTFDTRWRRNGKDFARSKHNATEE